MNDHTCTGRMSKIYECWGNSSKERWDAPTYLKLMDRVESVGLHGELRQRCTGIDDNDSDFIGVSAGEVG